MPCRKTYLPLALVLIGPNAGRGAEGVQQLTQGRIHRMFGRDLKYGMPLSGRSGARQHSTAPVIQEDATGN